MVHCTWSSFSTLPNPFDLAIQNNILAQESGIIGILAPNRQRYVGVGTDGRLYTNATTPGTNQEKFQIVENTDGTIGIKSLFRNTYVGIGTDNRAYANATQISRYETFVLFPNVNESFSMKAWNQRYLGVDPNNGTVWASDSTISLPNDTFQFVCL